MTVVNHEVAGVLRSFSAPSVSTFHEHSLGGNFNAVGHPNPITPKAERPLESAVLSYLRESAISRPIAVFLLHITTTDFDYFRPYRIVRSAIRKKPVLFESTVESICVWIAHLVNLRDGGE